jgi:Ca-activated chloride channel family protein
MHPSLRSSLSLTVLAVLGVLVVPALHAQAPPPDLAARYAAWLEEVAILISPKEKEAFLALGKDYQRDAFMRRFWQVRDPFPQTPINELKERWEPRAKLARERFGNLTDDRAKMMLFNGEPAEVLQGRCDVLLPVELWSYPGTERIRDSFSLAFVSRGGSPQGPYRLWSPGEGVESLLSLDLRTRLRDQGRGLAAIAELCPRGEDIAARLAESLDWDRVESAIQFVPKPSEEWLSTFASFSTDVPEGAASFPAQVDLSFPGRFGSRTVVQGLVTVPKEAVKPERIEGSSTATYAFVVDGEVLYKNELFEHFRYRFALPESEVGAADRIPIVFQRFLRPGSYSLVLKIENTAGKSFFREQRELEVPSAPTPPPAQVALAQTPETAAPSPQAPQAALAEANANSVASDHETIRILPPPPGLLTGKVRVEAAVPESSTGIAKVSFELNGKTVLAKSKPPYSVELNLGPQPRIHSLKALALDASGKTVATDEVQLNVGPHRFAVRLVEPQPGKTYKSSLRAQAEVEVPEGDELDRVEIFLNDDRVATLYQPPFAQPVLLPQSKEITYVRAVAYLKDGGSTEDLVLINAPDFTSQVDVQFVELYTSVVDNKGRPVDGLTQNDFKVLEDGEPQQVRRFELMRDVSVYAGILLDTSASMGEGEGEKIEEAVRGALRFFQKVVTPRDRAAVITFSDQPNLAVRFTNQEDVLAGGLAGLTPTGNTALYDSLIYALYYFGGVKGKRAIIILSDGKDEGSRHTYSDALEYARRSGVALYTVGIDLSTAEADVRLKLSRLADETGGRFFFIKRASELEGIYDSIQQELRSQYLLAYQSNKEGDEDDREKFRTVEVKMAKPGLEAKTLRGYYP